MTRPGPIDVIAPLAGELHLRRLLTDRRMALLAAAAASFAAGILSAQLMPRGPATAGQALLVMALGLAVGLPGGAASRGVVAVVPLALAMMAGVELGRLDVTGPTVDAIRLDTPYGILALLLGRGLHGLLAFLPMLAGALLGAWWIGWRARARTGLGRRVSAMVATLLSALLALLVALPASTPPVLDEAGMPVAGSIATLERIPLGGGETTLIIRAADPSKPVLLYLSGGPGQSDLALARVLSAGWTRDFVVADYDQRGNGTSYASLDPVSTLTLDGAVDDAIRVSELLRDRFGEQRIYLMGESWGTLLGVLAVERRPDLYHAWIGSGQMVDVRETDRRIYADLLAWADAHGDTAFRAQLERMGQPPYADIPWSNAAVMGWYELLYKSYTPSEGYRARGEASGLDPFGMLGSEYTFMDKANVLRGLIDTFAALYPQIQGLDLRRDAPRLEVPVWVLDGRAELEGRRSLALEWFDALEAPSKTLVPFDGAAHSVAFEQADEVQRLLTETIVPATSGR